MVAGFFFYSGFGIMESISRKGNNYLNRFPYHRFFKILLHFDIAILCFWLVRELLRIPTHWEEVLTAMTGWGSISNSNWFIFVTLVLYLITYVSFRWCGRWRWCALWSGCFMLLAILILRKEGYWYSTFLCFPAGMTFSVLRPWIERPLAWTKIPAPAYGLFFTLSAVYIYHFVAYRLGACHSLGTNVAAILMAYGTILLTAFIDFKKTPRGLIWMGSALFCIYIYQRIPMLVLEQRTDLEYNFALFLLLSLILTIILALVAERFYKWLDALCFTSTKR